MRNKVVVVDVLVVQSEIESTNNAIIYFPSNDIYQKSVKLWAKPLALKSEGKALKKDFKSNAMQVTAWTRKSNCYYSLFFSSSCINNNNLITRLEIEEMTIAHCAICSFLPFFLFLLFIRYN